MANNLRMKRSAVPAKVPLTSDLALAEFAINTHDGKVYIKKDVFGAESIVQVGLAPGDAGFAHTHAAADITSGVMAAARLGTGTPDNTKFLRGDGAWVTLSGGGNADTLNNQAGSYYLDWLNFTGVPSTFAPSAHTHAIADVTGLQAALDGKAASLHTHIIGDITGLQTALDGKAPTSHTHTLANITEFGVAGGYIRSNGSAWVRVSGVAWADLTSVPSTFTPSAHVHAAADVTSGTFDAARIPNLDASKINAGTLNTARISGTYTGITAIGTQAGNLLADGASRLVRKFSMLQSGYVESSPVNFRFDQDCLRFLNRWGTATITAPDLTTGEIDAVFSQYASFFNLLGKTDPVVITATFPAIGSTANTQFYPYVFTHSGYNGTVLIEIEKSGAPGVWETAYNGAIVGGFHVAEFTSGAGNLTGARWTFSGWSSNNYIRSLGVLSRNGPGYQWTVQRAGDTMYGNLNIANGATLQFDGVGITAFAKTILDDVDGPAVRTTIGAAAASHTHSVADLTTGTLNADVTITSGKFLRFTHASETNGDDGKIGAGLFNTGLNIVGVQTSPGIGRLIRLWGHIIPSSSGGSDLGITGNTWRDIHLGGNIVQAGVSYNLANLSAVGHVHSAADITSGTLAVGRGGTGIASYTANNYIRASGATTLEQRTPAQVLSDIGAAAASHVHAAGDVTSGTFADARIAASNVTQHNAVIAPTWANISGKPATFAPAAHDASLVTSGVFDIARIPVLPSQIQVISSGNIAALSAPEQASIGQGTVVTTTDGRRWIYSGSGSKVLEASYVEMADVTPEWTVIANKPSTFTPSAHTHNLTDLLDFGAAGGYIRSNGTAWVRVSGVAYSDLTGVPSTFAPSAHVHAIADVTGLQAALDGKAATSHVHSAADITTGTLVAARGGTGIGSYTANNYIRALNSTTLEQRTPAQVLSDIGAAAASHTHAASDVTSGTFADARIAASNVTQHNAVIAPTYANVSGKPATFTPSAHTHVLADITEFGLAGGYIRSNGTAWVRSAGVPWADLTSVPATFTPSAHSHAIADVTGLQAALDGKAATSHVHSAADITSGTLVAARGGTGIGSYTANNYIRALNATTLEQRTPAQVLSDIGAAATSHTHTLANITEFGAAGGYIRSNGTAWVRVSGVAWADLTSVPATFTPAAHVHAAADITSGVLATARLGTGVANSTVFLRGDGTWAAGGSFDPAAAANVTGQWTFQTKRLFIQANSEQYGLGVAFNASGGYVYFGAASGVAGPAAVISNASGTTLATFSNDGNATFGTGAGQQIVRINGANAGDNLGAAVYFQNAGTSNNAIGNHSAIIGGAYNTDLTMWSTGAARIFTGGIERVRINSNTNSTMDIVGRLNVTTALGVNRTTIDWGHTQSGMTVWNIDNTPLFLGTSGVNRMAITAAGEIDLGTSAVQTNSRLRMRKNGNNIEWGHTNTAGYGNTLGGEVGSGAGFLAFNAEAGTNNNTYLTRGIRGSVFRSDNNGGFIFGTADTASADNQSIAAHFTVNRLGDAHLGGSSPVNFGATWRCLTIGGGSNNGVIRLQSTSGTAVGDIWTDTSGLFIRTTTNHAMVFRTNDVTRLTIGTGGEATFTGLIIGRPSVGNNVNTNNDTGSMSVRSDSSNAASITFHRTSAYAINMGLGTDNVFRIGGWSASNDCLQMSGTGNLTMLGNVTAYSDERLKTNIQTLDPLKVFAMRGVSFLKNGEQGSGVIAQEMQKVAPELVNKEFEFLSVAYGNISGYIIEGMKYLKGENEKLKAELAEIKQLVMALYKMQEQ